MGKFDKYKGTIAMKLCSYYCRESVVILIPQLIVYLCTVYLYAMEYFSSNISFDITDNQGIVQRNNHNKYQQAIIYGNYYVYNLCQLRHPITWEIQILNDYHPVYWQCKFRIGLTAYDDNKEEDIGALHPLICEHEFVSINNNCEEISCITYDHQLHGNTTVENNTHQLLKINDIIKIQISKRLRCDTYSRVCFFINNELRFKQMIRNAFKYKLFILCDGNGSVRLVSFNDLI